jgi:hypothetical protein
MTGRAPEERPEQHDADPRIPSGGNAVSVQYYDFTIDGVPVGYFEVSVTSTQIYMNARFVAGEDCRDNPFWVSIADGRPVRCKAGETDWRVVPEDSYPSSAFPLVVRKRLTQYRCFDEASGRLKDVQVTYTEDDVVEEVDGVPRRRFRVQGDDIVWIWWGGTAQSELKPSLREAVAGTPYA